MAKSKVNKEAKVEVEQKPWRHSQSYSEYWSNENGMEDTVPFQYIAAPDGRELAMCESTENADALVAILNRGERDRQLLQDIVRFIDSQFEVEHRISKEGVRALLEIKRRIKAAARGPK